MSATRGIDLSEKVNNVMKYELFPSKDPTEQTIEKYIEQLSNSSNGANSYFKLKIDASQKSLYGKYKFNENIEEEWLIIYLLFELSKFDEDLVIRIRDNDGDILLIEAAEHLPEWLETASSKYRVFIHQGLVHVIPRDVDLNTLKANGDGSDKLSLLAANFVRSMNAKDIGPSTRVKTVASSTIQSAIREKLVGMPDVGTWLNKRLEELDAVISNNNEAQPDLTLDSIKAMRDENFEISPLSSYDSSDWSTESEQES